jgi:hypothetical protein
MLVRPIVEDGNVEMRRVALGKEEMAEVTEKWKGRTR